MNGAGACYLQNVLYMNTGSVECFVWEFYSTGMKDSSV